MYMLYCPYCRKTFLFLPNYTTHVRDCEQRVEVNDA